LIAAGTSFATDGLAAVLAADVEVDAGVELVDELLLLLPQAASAPTHISETGTASQFLNDCIKNSFPRRRRQHRPERVPRQTF
jgi:hypothetical protein